MLNNVDDVYVMLNELRQNKCSSRFVKNKYNDGVSKPEPLKADGGKLCVEGFGDDLLVEAGRQHDDISMSFLLILLYYEENEKSSGFSQYTSYLSPDVSTLLQP